MLEKNPIFHLVLIFIASSPLLAQDSSAGQPSPKVWTGSVGAGLSLTTGNSETFSLNASFELVRDPGTRNLIKADGFYLRGRENQVLSKDRLRLSFRDEYTLSEKVFFSGGTEYLRDPFKDIDYLFNPTAGIGYKLVSTERVGVNFGGGAGVVWEKAPGVDVLVDPSVNAGQELVLHLSDSARISQKVSGLWKANNFEDALYHFGIALAASIIKNMELKVEFQDDYKSRPLGAGTLKNDTATILSFVFKF